MNLEGTVALVTGAGHRLGRAMALGLAEAGSDVFVHYGRSAEAAERTVRDIQALGRRAAAGSADLSDPGGAAELWTAFDAEFDGLDVLVNSAASFDRKPFEDITTEDWDAVQALNLRAPFTLTQRALSRIRSKSRTAHGSDDPAPGAIINLVDHAGITTWRGYVHHGVSKAALLHLTKSTARVLGPDVRVNAIVPGAILPPPGESTEDPAWLRKGDRVPLGRVGDPAHIAHAAVFLAQNDYVTGETLFVDGGEHLLPGGRD